MSPSSAKKHPGLPIPPERVLGQIESVWTKGVSTHLLVLTLVRVTTYM